MSEGFEFKPTEVAKAEVKEIAQSPARKALLEMVKMYTSKVVDTYSDKENFSAPRPKNMPKN
jgi:hypothetical protein